MELPILVFAIVLNLFFSLTVLLRNPKSATNILFTLLSIDIAAWSIVNFLSVHTPDSSLSLLLIRLVMFLAVPQAVLFFLLMHTWPNNKIVLNRKIYFIILYFAFITMGVALSPYLFTHVVIENDIATPVPGPGMILFAIVAIGSVLAGLLNLALKYQKAVGLQKVQLRYILAGITIMFMLIITFNFVFVVFFRNLFFIIFSPLFTFPFIGSMAYTIVRHRLLDIRIAVVRTVTFTILVFLLAAIFSTGVFLSSSFLLGYQIDVQSLGILVVLALLISFSRDPILHSLEKYTVKIFFRGAYNSQSLLGRMSKIMASTLELTEMADKLLNELSSAMKFSGGSIVLIRGSKTIWNFEQGMKIVEANDYRNLELPHFIRWLVRKPGENILVFDELDESNEKNIMRDYNVKVILALVVKDEPIGALLLGEKSSGDIYSSQDIDVLKILAPEIAVAVNNSLSYEEIKRFNITLADEVKRATQDLKNANERLKQLDKLKDEFVSLASHELRTPMTVIKSYLWLLLQQRNGKLNEKQIGDAQRAYSSTERLINLVNDMLNVSRIESGRLTLHITPVDMEKLVKEVVDEMIPRASEQKLKLVFNKTLPHPPIVKGDSERIKEVLINLIGNSLKFTPENGAITLTQGIDGQILTTHVLDTGIGIKKDDMQKLFYKFGVIGGNYTTKQANQGTGLGLYLSKSLIELQGGKLRAQSEGENKGSMFSFSLPMMKT